MSDNIIRPDKWAGNGGDGGGGDGIDGAALSARVDRLDADLRQVDTTVRRLEVSLTRVEAGLSGRLDTLTERLHAHGETLGRVEAGLRDLSAKVDSKLIGGWQMFGIFAGLIAIMAAALGFARAVGLLH